MLKVRPPASGDLVNNDIIEEGDVKEGDVYDGFCCEGYGWQVALVFGSIWGHCKNSECKNCIERTSLDDLIDWLLVNE